MLSKSTQWVNVLLSIDLANVYVCNFVYVVLLLFHWWNIFFPFNLIDFGANGNTFGWGTSLVLMLGAFVFFIICISCPLLLCKFSSNTFTQLKQRSNHMLTLVMLNPMKNQAIWGGTRAPSMTLPQCHERFINEFGLEAETILYWAINDFWTSVTNVFPQNRTFWRQKKLCDVARVTNLFCFVSGGGGSTLY